MNCKEINGLLADLGGDPAHWPLHVREHIDRCPSCSIIFSAQMRAHKETYAEVLVGSPPQTVANEIAETLTRVQPLPSNVVMFVQGFAILWAVVCLACAWLGVAGFEGLSGMQRIAFSLTLVAMAACLAYGYTQSLVPGALIRFSALKVAGFCGALFAILVITQFAHNPLHMIPIHRECFLRGLIVAALTVGLELTLRLRSFWSDPSSGVAILFTTGGATALLVLTIYCPFQDTGHVLIAHVGSVLVAVISGLVIARLTFPRVPG